MREKEIEQYLLTRFDFEPTKDQSAFFSSFARYLVEREERSVFLLKGYAGTGKTSVLYALIQSLPHWNLRSVLLAPTGRAAKVLTSYTKKAAFTIHKKIYRQKSLDSSQFVLDKNMHTNTIFFIDEASMLSNSASENTVFGSGKLLDDLLDYVFSGKGCSLVLIGDTAQLPPVKLNLSPALSVDFLRGEGLHIRARFLRQIMRQDERSGILRCATQVRTLLQEEQQEFPLLMLNDCSDVVPISDDELTDRLNEAYTTYGKKNCMVITRSNKRAIHYNRGIREKIFFHEEELSTGELLMVVKNNYFWSEDEKDLEFIANGDMIELLHISHYEEKYGMRFVNATIRLIEHEDIELDVKLLFNSLYSEAPSLSKEQGEAFIKAIEETYQSINSRRKRWQQIKKDPYFNALQVKFGYAITCHKAQGGQWQVVFVDHGWLAPNHIPNIEWLRWLYTAFTRPTEKLYLVNFASRFFPKSY